MQNNSSKKNLCKIKRIPVKPYNHVTLNVNELNESHAKTKTDFGKRNLNHQKRHAYDTSQKLCPNQTVANGNLNFTKKKKKTSPCPKKIEPQPRLKIYKISLKFNFFLFFVECFFSHSYTDSASNLVPRIYCNYM